VEQALNPSGEEPIAMPEVEGFEVRITAKPDRAGAVGQRGLDIRDYARRKVGQLGRFAPRPVVRARVKLGWAPDPATERPALAQAMLDVSGRVIRAHAAARQLDEAVDLLEARLCDRLQHLHSRLRARRRRAGIAMPGQWRHGDLDLAILVPPREGPPPLPQRPPR
jgi:ribosome-associated translation inhibitor RaiA